MLSDPPVLQGHRHISAKSKCTLTDEFSAHFTFLKIAKIHGVLEDASQLSVHDRRLAEHELVRREASGSSTAKAIPSQYMGEVLVPISFGTQQGTVLL
jgi:hypothetical protein